MTASQRRKALKRLLRAAIYCPNHALPYYDRPSKPWTIRRAGWFGRIMGGNALNRWALASDR